MDCTNAQHKVNNWTVNIWEKPKNKRIELTKLNISLIFKETRALLAPAIFSTRLPADLRSQMRPEEPSAYINVCCTLLGPK